jgi:hypothetical protein
VFWGQGGGRMINYQFSIFNGQLSSSGEVWRLGCWDVLVLGTWYFVHFFLVNGPQSTAAGCSVGSGQWAVGSSQRSTVHGPQQRDVQWAVGSGQFAVCSLQ